MKNTVSSNVPDTGPSNVPVQVELKKSAAESPDPHADMSITSKKKLLAGDVLLACSDGLWSGLGDEDMAEIGLPGDNNLPDNLKALSIKALNANAPYSDNTTGTALRWLGS